jgi:hypothetical protein
MEKHFYCWVVAATFLTPPLKFDHSDHTRPSLSHHGSIIVACFGQDAANGGEMSRRLCRSSGKNFIFIFLDSSFSGRVVCPVGV